MNELDLFVAAVAIADPAERAAFLDRACAADAALRQRLEALLAGSEQSRSPIDHPAAPPLGGPTVSHGGQPATCDPVPVEQAGAVIAGKYTLVEVIGEGGMGSVSRAKQTEPVKRFVAVKLIKAGMDSRQVLARFEAERQALALMDHPNIAKVLDGGVVEQAASLLSDPRQAGSLPHVGRPYFVMELVKGVPITEYCDKCKLTPKERLELFVPVCQAIQHAHQKGIIHRDIKPSNVLIALYDDKPVVKVIDFGVAKATGGALTERTIDTGFGGVVGTPQYMSPEQATFNNLDIDTRSDVYALGVLLYELLTGSPPFAKKDLEKRGLLEILRVVREEEPLRPSAKLSTAAALPTLSANRGTEPKHLTGLLRNDLDWIVMKALEKDRTRRYETANGFAADVLRYLSGEAVQAHPPSTAYQVQKFVRRHQGQVLAASLVLFALLAGMAGTTWGLIQAEQSAAAERQAKVEAQGDRATAVKAAAAERAAKLDAQEKKTLAEKAAASERLAKRDAEEKKTRAELAAKAERAAKLEAEGQKKKAEEEKAIAVAVKAFLQNLLGQAGAMLQAGGLAAQAKQDPTIRELLDWAAEELSEAKIEANFPKQPLLQAEILQTVGRTYHGVGEPGRAIGYLQRSLALRKTTLGLHHPDTLTSMNNLALAYQEAGQLDLALPLFEQTLRLRKAKLGPEHPQTLTSMNNLASAYQAVGKLDKALPLFEQTLQLMKAKIGPEHPQTLTSMNNLASAYRAVGKLDKALPLLEETLQLRKAKLGPDHPHTLTSMNNLALGYQAAGKLDKALPLLEETLQLRKAKLGPDHPDTLNSMASLAVAYQAAGKRDLAVPLFKQTLQLRKAKLGPDHPHTLESMNNLAVAYQAAGKRNLAVPLLEETLKLRKAKLGPDHPHTLSTMGNLFSAYVQTGEKAEAAQLLPELLTLTRKRLPKDSPQLAGMLATLCRSLLQAKAFTEAEPLLRECLAIRERTQPHAWMAFDTQSLLGEALLGQKKYAEAEPLLLKGYEGMKQRQKTIPPWSATRLPEALDRLIELYTATNQPDEAKKWLAERAKYPETKPTEKK